MKIIKRMSSTIEDIINSAEKNIRDAFETKEEDLESSKAYYNKSVEELGSIKAFHDRIVALIKNYRAEKGEPPAPMMAVYDYLHERHIDMVAGIKRLQEMYKNGA